MQVTCDPSAGVGAAFAAHFFIAWEFLEISLLFSELLLVCGAQGCVKWLTR